MTHSRPIKVLVVDDHPLMRAGITAVVSSNHNLSVIGEAESGDAAIALFKQLRPDVVLMDLRMGRTGGIEAIQQIRLLDRNAKIIVLTSAVGDIQAKRALQAGASSYLLKSSARSELLETIQLVHAGLRHIPTAVASEIAQHSNDHSITPRELEVLRSMAKGLPNKLIAEELDITEHTVKNNVKRLLSKLGARDRTHAVLIALDRGFIER